MLVRFAPDVALAFQGIQAIHGRFVRVDLTAGLDLADQRGATALSDVALNIVQYRLLFGGKLGQSRSLNGP